jgi:hypothetical protein
MNMAIEELLLSCPVGRWRTEQAIVFDWNDGPRQGIATLAFPECEFVFELIEERFNPTGLDHRLFRLRELPVGSVRSVLGLITQLGRPSKPVWVPVWKFATEVEKQEADRAIDVVLAEARATDLVVLSQDMEHFGGAWVVKEDQRGQTDWFGFLGIP